MTAPDLPRGLVSRGLAGTLQAFMWVLALCVAVVGVVALVARSNFVKYWDAPIGSVEEAEAFDLWQDYENAMAVWFVLAMLAWVVVSIVLIIWMYQAHHASQRISPEPRTWSQGWTIGGWFIPVANLLIPRLVLGEIETIAYGRPSGGSGSTRWVRGSQSGTGWVWWVLMVGGMVVTFIGFSVLPTDTFFFIGDPEAYRNGYATIAVGCFVAAGGMACGAVHVSQVTKALNHPS